MKFSIFQEEAAPALPDVPAFLASALSAAHQRILRYAIDNNVSDTPRTTVVAAVVQAGAATWIHCGDSRLYLVRHDELLARTRDHSAVEHNQGMDANLTSPQRVNRHVLFTCLGSSTAPEFDLTGPVALQQGDKLMLCSDGLWDSLSDADIVCQLGQKPVDKAVPDLVEKALRKAGGSSDNVTCIALAWETPDGFACTVQTGALQQGNHE